jgi:hypothetical protein
MTHKTAPTQTIIPVSKIISDINSLLLKFKGRRVANFRTLMEEIALEITPYLESVGLIFENGHIEMPDESGFSYRLFNITTPNFVQDKRSRLLKRGLLDEVVAVLAHPDCMYDDYTNLSQYCRSVRIQRISKSISAQEAHMGYQKNELAESEKTLLGLQDTLQKLLNDK